MNTEENMDAKIGLPRRDLKLAESKGSPPVDWETVWCMQKPEQAALWET